MLYLPISDQAINAYMGTDTLNPGFWGHPVIVTKINENSVDIVQVSSLPSPFLYFSFSLPCHVHLLQIQTIIYLVNPENVLDIVRIVNAWIRLATI